VRLAVDPRTGPPDDLVQMDKVVVLTGPDPVNDR
jgi:hypothetical protein